MPKYTETSIKNALHEVSTGVPLKTAAQRWGIPPSTLRNRKKGHKPRSVAYAPYQRLSREQEKALTHWILGQTMLGSPPTHAQVRGLAQRILHHGGDDRPLGVNWIQGFLAHNPEIESLRGMNLNST